MQRPPPDDVAVLFDPAEPWEPWAPQAGWNGKIVWPFGPAAGTLHSQGLPGNVLDATRLGEGFMVATHSMNQHSTNLNTVVSAESVMMLQEHITETYGEIRYVIGRGGSGASIQQQTIAYRTGQVNDAQHLNLVPIIDLRPSENNGIHTNFHTWEMKERLSPTLPWLSYADGPGGESLGEPPTSSPS